MQRKTDRRSRDSHEDSTWRGVVRSSGAIVDRIDNIYEVLCDMDDAPALVRWWHRWRRYNQLLLLTLDLCEAIRDENKRWSTLRKALQIAVSRAGGAVNWDKHVKVEKE